MRGPDELPALSAGQLIRLYRQRAGMTRAVLAGLVGKSVDWVKSVETGRILPPRLTTLGQIARALQVPVQSLITVDEQVVLHPGAAHPALSQVRRALNQWAAPDDPAPSLEHIDDRVAAAWRARHAAPDHRTVIGSLLPDLIRDVQLACRTYSGPERRRAQAQLADVLGLAQMFLAYQPAADLLWRVADRAMLAAQESGSPLALAQASWFAIEAHRDAGDWDTAQAVTHEVLAALRPHLPDADNELLAMSGALHAAAAFTAARSGRSGSAWRSWDEADRIMQRLPEGYYQRATSFSRPVIIAHAVTLEVELRRGARAVRLATAAHGGDVIPSRPRRARHLIEVARGHHLGREDDAVLGLLVQAYRTAPETIRFNGYARQMASDVLAGSPALRRQATDLALKIGLAG
ncbi:multiprotein-bridging factor 1 family protein [Actinoplanes sp. NPDC051859]|uniref:multiprotein-bridging factor 1 family protein n=1 Tax=Actinoplanes sp. NPDC051859 TaxID=3363909 RepID=UPI0037916239